MSDQTDVNVALLKTLEQQSAVNASIAEALQVISLSLDRIDYMSKRIDQRIAMIETSLKVGGTL